MATIATTGMKMKDQSPTASTRGAEDPVRPLADGIAKELVQLFKLLSDETRLQILNYLKQNRELNVRSLCKLLGQSQPSVSHHLALLRVAGMIDMRREGKHNYYRIVTERFDKLIDLVVAATQSGGSKDPIRRLRADLV